MVGCRRGRRFRFDDGEDGAASEVAQHAGADAAMILPVTYLKLSEREIFKLFLSIGDAIGISIMCTTTQPPVALI
jgi:hypothetical protein